MTDIELAINNLESHSICLCKKGEIITDDGRGISPMIRFISEGYNLSGYSAADIIVGKAAAILFIKAGIVCVHGKIMSERGKKLLNTYGIPYTYDVLTERIINRQNTDICPMEKAVADTDDPEKGYSILLKRLEELKKIKTI